MSSAVLCPCGANPAEARPPRHPTVLRGPARKPIRLEACSLATGCGWSLHRPRRIASRARQAGASTALLALLGLVGCLADSPGGGLDADGGPARPIPDPTSDGGSIGRDGEITNRDGGGLPGLRESAKSSVRYKRNERLRNDFAQALGIDPGALCRELGQYSCTDIVHTVALGGVEPYVLGLREPLPFTTITTPIAAERVAFAACEQRVSFDFASPQAAVIFKELGVDQNGAIPNIDGAPVASSIDTLYKRMLQRAPEESEVRHIRQLYRDLEATGEPGPARDWAILACVSVLTSMEALFY